MVDSVVQTLISPIMVGRDQAVQTLTRLFNLASTGQGQIALVSGEAGIGKSRLLREFEARLPSPALLVVRGVCFETDQTLPYAPITDLLRTYLASLSTEYKQAVTAESGAEIARLLPELIIDTPDVQAVVSEGDLEKRQLQSALVRLFARLTHPLVVIIEDVHWCDDASLEFLLFFARQLNSTLMLLTYRDDETSLSLARFLAQLNRDRLATELPLHRLPLENVGTIVQAIFTDEFASPRKFIDAIYNLSEGNPFFIEEILKSLVAAGDIYTTDGHWKVKPLFELHISRTIKINLSQRLERLSSAAREVLSLAAVAGRRFDFSLLQNLSGLGESDLVRIIRELRDAQFIIEETADRFTFRHALTQQAVYDDLLLRERRSLHRTIAETLESLHRSDLTYVSELAYHFDLAEMWEKSARYSQQAAEWAAKLYSPSAAIEHYTRALDALARLEQPPTPELWGARGQMYERVGNFERAREDYTHMIAASHAADNRVAEWQGWLDLAWLWTARDFARAGEYFMHVLELVQHMEASPLLAQTLNRVGNWHLHADQLDQGLHYHLQAQAISEQLHDVRGQAETLDLLGLTYFYLGEMTAGTDCYARCVALFRQLGDFSGLSASLSVMSMRGASYNLDTFACPVVQLETCIQEGEEAVEAARKLGWRAGEASALIYCGFGLGSRGEFDRALRATHLGLSIADEIEHGQWSGAAHMVLGAIYRDMLAFREARDHHEAVFKVVQDLHSPFLLRMVAGHLAYTNVICGELALAEQVLQQVWTPDLPMLSIGQRIVWCAKAELALANDQPETALEIVQHLIEQVDPPRGTIPRLEYLKGEALRLLGRYAAAEHSLKLANQAAELQGVPSLQWRIQVSLGKSYQGQRRYEHADDIFADAQETVQRLADSVSDRVLHDQFLLHANVQIDRVYHPSARRAAKKAADGLTAREREIALLVTDGKSNRVIADELILSERTVAKHLENILSKLGFTSRAQIAAWSVEHKLRGS